MTLYSVGFIVLVLVLISVRQINEYQRGIMFTLGRYTGLKGPGWRLVWPIIQSMKKIDIRVRTIDVPDQETITKDNISVRINAVLYFKVRPESADRAIIQVEDFYNATSQLAQTTLRSVLGGHELDEMLAERERLNYDIQEILDKQTDAWGIKISNVEIKHIDLDESMVRAIAKQAEAERERRAKVINAKGELEASENILEAAKKLSQNELGIQLRYLQTMSDISNDKTNTLIFPFPTELGKFLKNNLKE